METSKQCPSCTQVLPGDAFYRRRKGHPDYHPNNPRYYSTYCRDCDREAGQKYRDKHRGSRFIAKTLPEYLAQHTEPGELDSCWEWQGSRTHGGYGEACFKRNRKSAHVFAYIAAHGPLPDGVCVLHKCDNPPCCNPLHLFLGTFAENNKDRNRKGRSYRKLTPDQVITIRQLRTNNVPYQQIANLLGMGYGTIYNAAKPHTHPYLHTE